MTILGSLITIVAIRVALQLNIGSMGGFWLLLDSSLILGVVLCLVWARRSSVAGIWNASTKRSKASLVAGATLFLFTAVVTFRVGVINGLVRYQQMAVVESTRNTPIDKPLVASFITLLTIDNLLPKSPRTIRESAGDVMVHVAAMFDGRWDIVNTRREFLKYERQMNMLVALFQICPLIEGLCERQAVVEGWVNQLTRIRKRVRKFLETVSDQKQKHFDLCVHESLAADGFGDELPFISPEAACLCMVAPKGSARRSRCVDEVFLYEPRVYVTAIDLFAAHPADPR